MKSFYCLIIYLSIHLCGYAILPTQFHFRHYNIENGISANNISALLQDQKGFIWIGTENGLNRFDGNQFTLYQKKQSTLFQFPRQFNQYHLRNYRQRAIVRNGQRRIHLQSS